MPRTQHSQLRYRCTCPRTARRDCFPSIRMHWYAFVCSILLRTELNKLNLRLPDPAQAVAVVDGPSFHFLNDQDDFGEILGSWLAPRSSAGDNFACAWTADGGVFAVASGSAVTLLNGVVSGSPLLHRPLASTMHRSCLFREGLRSQSARRGSRQLSVPLSLFKQGAELLQIGPSAGWWSAGSVFTGAAFIGQRAGESGGAQRRHSNRRQKCRRMRLLMIPWRQASPEPRITAPHFFPPPQMHQKLYCWSPRRPSLSASQHPHGAPARTASAIGPPRRAGATGLRLRSRPRRRRGGFSRCELEQRRNHRLVGLFVIASSLSRSVNCG